MSQKYVITDIQLQNKNVLFCGLYEDHKLIEANLFSNQTDRVQLNAIYIARVSQVVSSLQAAFVDIGDGQICYLPLSDIAHDHVIYVKRISKNKPLVQGDEIVVQIVKEAIKTKNPQVTTKLSLAGLASVVCYGDQRLGISTKLSQEERQKLRELVKPYYDKTVGIIVRTNAIHVDEHLLIQEVDALSRQLKEIIQVAPGRTVFSCLYRPAEEYIRILMDQNLEVLDEVITDQPEIYQRLADFASQNPSVGFDDKLTCYSDPLLELQNLYSIHRDLERALNTKVWLKSGANLLIEPTEALTVIDINSSKNSSKKKDPAVNFKINCEAAEMIAKQLRLRNISGIIIIDFIDMQSEDEKAQLILLMKRLLKNDKVPCNVVDFTALGLMELTRKKVRPSLQQQFLEIEKNN